MKFLISNYSSESQTEPFYFNTSINLLNGYKSTLWDNNTTSAYDIFDLVKPDYYITHISAIPTDVIDYLRNHKTTSIILNVTGETRDNLEKMEQILIEESIKCPFFYTNSDDEVYKLKNIKMLSIPFGADVFFNTGSLSFNIDKGVIINSENDIKHYETPHHIISYNTSLINVSDMVLSIQQMAAIYKNYNEIIFTFFGNLIPQVFYDAIYYGNKVYYDIDDPEKNKILSQKLEKILKIDCDLRIIKNFNKIKQTIKEKHTCLHRVKSLLSQLPSEDGIKNIDNLIELYNKGGT